MGENLGCLTGAVRCIGSDAGRFFGDFGAVETGGVAGGLEVSPSFESSSDSGSSEGSLSGCSDLALLEVFAAAAAVCFLSPSATLDSVLLEAFIFAAGFVSASASLDSALLEAFISAAGFLSPSSSFDSSEDFVALVFAAGFLSSSGGVTFGAGFKSFSRIIGSNADMRPAGSLSTNTFHICCPY